MPPQLERPLVQILVSPGEIFNRDSQINVSLYGVDVFAVLSFNVTC
jgi:hypothetical protein